MNLSLEAIEVLDAIDRNGSFAGAAHELGKVPSAITYAVRRLEEDLDVLLFDRRKYRAELTGPGRALLDEGRHLLRSADELAARIKRLATGWESELAIACDAIVDFDALWPLITDFDREQAPTRLRFSREVLGGTWDALLSGRADIVIGAPNERPPTGDHIDSHPLGEVPLVFVVAPRHPLAAAPEPVAAATIAPHRAIAVGDTSRQLPARSKGILTGQPTLVVPQMADKIEAQRRGLGCGWLPAHLAAPLIARGELVAKQTANDGEPVVAHLAWRTGNRGKALAWWLKRLQEPRLAAALFSRAR